MRPNTRAERAAILHFPDIPAWFTAPVALAMMVLIAAHAEATRRSEEPASRKRIRLANGALMMLTLPLLVAGFSVIDPARHPREWALVWLTAMSLLSMNVLLAIIDALNTMRLMAGARRRLRADLLRFADDSATHAREPRNAPHEG